MSCIGTAGHVDHGKSTLVKALTGIDPDRLAEEKARGMTIDLGFAWLTLPGGQEVSIVDVPGHESFIKNMLAGVGGIDAALLVIAADEGVMPQTREHLAILDLLRVPQGVVALTKADLVDEEWLELVREEVENQLKGTTLADARIVPVSAYTGSGLADLLAELDRLLSSSPERQNIARPRLPIDRVFTLTGFGTIVTGTLLDGSLKLGQEVEVLPQGLRARIRSLQTHRRQVEVAQPGSRVALNLPNIARSDLERGNVVTQPNQLQATLLFDAHIHLLSTAERPLSHNSLVELYSGSQEVLARVRLLDRDELEPGQNAWAQLRLSQQAVVARRDRFILRIPSPSITIGGGEVVAVQPRYHKRFQHQLFEDLERLLQGSPEELVLAALDRRATPKRPEPARLQGKGGHGPAGYTLDEIARLSNLSENVTLQIVETLLLQERVRRIGIYWFALHAWEELAEEAVRLVREQHERYPLRSGLSREQWRARLNLSPKLALEVFASLQAEGRLETVADARGGLICIPGFTPRFTTEQQIQVKRLLQLFRHSPYAPPARAEAEEIVGAEVLAALLEQGQLVKLPEGILFLRETYEEATTRLVDYLRTHTTLTVAEARDLLGATRKYILPLLEQLDALHITRRQGDSRILGVAALPLSHPEGQVDI